MSQNAVIDLAFPLTPGKVPLDHGYALYGALAESVPEVHGATWLAIHPLEGRRVGESTLLLSSGSMVTLRVPVERIPVALKLARRSIRIGTEGFQLGEPTLKALEPSASLFAWQVAIRLTNPPKLDDGGLDMDAFKAGVAAEAKRQLVVLGINAPFELLARRQLRVKDQRTVAFSVQVDGLAEADSLKLQASGLGGKRRMGCGVFRAARQQAEVG